MANSTIRPCESKPIFGLGNIFLSEKANELIPREIILNALALHGTTTNHDGVVKNVHNWKDGVQFFIRTDADRCNTFIALVGEPDFNFRT